jgi:ribosomal protein S18 acetylase RimI-like enzyme
MDIRPARPQDVPDVLPMVGKICALHEAWDAAKYGFLANPDERYRRWLTARADDPRAVFLVAERESKAVAFLIGTIEQEIPIYRLKEYGFIHDVWVEEEYRHEGIGRQMVMLAIEQFKAAGVTQIRLDTAGANEAARKLFAGCGFRVSTIEMLAEI